MGRGKASFLQQEACDKRNNTVASHLFFGRFRTRFGSGLNEL